MNNQLTPSRFLSECLKPEEICGDNRESRLNELMSWFDRYYNGNANPKWFKAHVAELCYYVLSEAELQEHRKATPNHSGDTADMVESVSNRDELNYPATPGGYVLVPKEITCAMDDAAWEAYHETRCMSDVWIALLAAAPKEVG